MKLVPIRDVIIELTHLAIFLEQDNHRVEINTDRPLKEVLAELNKCAGDTIGEIALAEMEE